ncbi:uncharacterized protein KRP23_11922 [Phytophthora ramorum]|uniref:uncharacterized protein n=1 Tax=Phytophthora ramorum TaxID=164328 RepID=UPI003095B90C|nr:hypothetical protein KRP23_11922 [Phytophthora ramorum]
MAMAEVAEVDAEVDEKEGLLRSVVVASARARWRATTTWYLCKLQKPLDAASRSVGGGATPVAQDAGDAGARGRGRGRGGAAVAAALALAARDSDESLILDSADDDVVLVEGPYVMDYPPFDR